MLFQLDPTASLLLKVKLRYIRKMYLFPFCGQNVNRLNLNQSRVKAVLRCVCKTSKHRKVIRWAPQGACGITSEYRLNNMDVGVCAFPSAAKAMWFMGCACSTNTSVLPMIAAVIPQNSFTDRKAFLKVWHVCLNGSLAVVWLCIILHILWVVLRLSTCLT